MKEMTIEETVQAIKDEYARQYAEGIITWRDIVGVGLSYNPKHLQNIDPKSGTLQRLCDLIEIEVVCKIKPKKKVSDAR